MAYGDKFKELEQLYSSHTCCQIETLADDGLLITDAELEAWVKDIYTNGKGSMHVPTVHKIAQRLWQGVQDGYGKNFNEVDLNSSDANMLNHLYNNCYTFSAAKNRTHLQQLTGLINNNGKIREWADYYQEALKLNLKINKTWLKTEYDLAIAGGTMASKWNEFSSTPDAMLRYSTVGDDRVRDSHRALDGVTLPVSHPFWNSAYPPNGFKCRCDVDRIPYSTPVTAGNKIPSTGDDTIPPLFQVNLAKDKLVFPPKHPYYTTATKDAAKAANTAATASTTEVDLGSGFTPPNLDEFKAIHDSEIDTSIFSFLKRETLLINNKKAKGAYYSVDKNEVHLPLNRDRVTRCTSYLPRVLYHEFGHAIDWQHNLRHHNLVSDVMDKHRKIFRKGLNKGYKEIDKLLFDLGKKAYLQKDYDLTEMIGAISDTICSLNPNYGSGHSKSYFKRPGLKEAEFLAHMFENVFAGNPVFKEHLPELYDDMLVLWQQLKKEVILK